MKETIQMSLEEWKEKYIPIADMWIFDEQDREFLKRQDIRSIWTECSMGYPHGSVIMNGGYGVDRIATYVTEVLWEDGVHIEVYIPEEED